MGIQENDLSAYRAAGVDTRAEEEALSLFLKQLQATFKFGSSPELTFGHFANIITVGEVSIAVSTDGVGTKTIVAQLMDRYDTIGIDCVAMNVNDVLCLGARPRTMVDYIAVQKVNPRVLEDIGKGLYEGARQAQVSISGGELAQLPEELLGEEEGLGFDLVGTCVGTLKPGTAITGARVSPGDAVLGLRSSGIHSSGLTLARRALGLTREKSPREKRQILESWVPDLGTTLGEELLKPSRIYVPEILEMLEQQVDIRGLAHITGDGLLNLPRLDATVGYVLDSLPEPQPIFRLIQRQGGVSDEEMYEVFNMGIGFCAVVPERDLKSAIEIAHKHGSEATRIGYVVEDPTRSVELPAIREAGRRGKGFHKIA